MEEKYLLYFLIYLYCCAVFWIEMQIVPELADVNFVRSVVMVFGFRLFAWAYSFLFNIDLGMKKQSC